VLQPPTRRKKCSARCFRVCASTSRSSTPKPYREFPNDPTAAAARLVEELDVALNELERIFIGQKKLDKNFCALRHDLARVQTRLIKLADSLEGDDERA
jgi:hypothetical protein